MGGLVSERVDPAGAENPVRVLVVEDNDVIRDLIVVNLQLEGFDVRSAGDGMAALEAVTEWRPDVITLDVVMPRLGGFETLERLRADDSTAAIPVVIVTARAQAADRSRGERLGADAYLTKPFEPADLVAVVTELAHRQR